MTELRPTTITEEFLALILAELRALRATTAQLAHELERPGVVSAAPAPPCPEEPERKPRRRRPRPEPGPGGVVDPGTNPNSG
jgi:hypothetical protein